jgi:hypothetical protein
MIASVYDGIVEHKEYQYVSDLTFVERLKLEKLFDMGSGYVLDFSNRTFKEFIANSAGCDIYCGKYDYSSCSKANLLRKFWEIEPNHITGKVLRELIDLASEQSSRRYDKNLFDECRKIVERLQQDVSVEELKIIGEGLKDSDFSLLVKTIRSSIDSNEPEGGLDRLHTFVTKFIRHLCEKKRITVSKEKPLHSLLGEYIKKMRDEGRIETQMAERILKSSIGNLEAFNSVRNDHGFAHDNPILGYDESLLIFNHVVSSITFIQALERRQSIEEEQFVAIADEDIPF